MTVEQGPLQTRQKEPVENGRQIPTVLVDFSQPSSGSSGNKTPRMLEVEARYEGTPIEKLFDKWYWELNMSVADIAKEIGIPPSTLCSWAKMLNLSVRPRSEAVSLSWQDPEKRANRIAGGHTDTANDKRSEALENYFRSNTKEVRFRRERLARGAETRARERKKRVLGKHPRQALRRFVEKENLSDPEIANRLRRDGHDISRTTVQMWRKKLGIPARSIRASGGHIKPADEEVVEQAIAHGVLSRLTNNEKFVIQIRFPGKGRPVPTLEQVATEVGVTREAIRQREKRAIRKLR